MLRPGWLKMPRDGAPRSDVRRIKSGWCAMDHDGNRQEFFD
jgi:hypothetical protein